MSPDRQSVVRLLGAVVATVVIGGMVAGSAGCGKKDGNTCDDDNQCGDNRACMSGTCLPRAANRTLAVEIQPRTDSSSARTEIPNLGFDDGPGQLLLYADEKVTVEGTVAEATGSTPSSPSTLAATAHILATVPSLLLGHADLQFQGDVVGFKFNFGVGKKAIGQQATLWLLPDAKTPLQPPVPFTRALGLTTDLDFPRSADLTVVRGFLHNSLDAPEMGFVARAYVGVDTTVVSNTATTDDTGQFQLLIAPAALPASAGGMVTIEFVPANPADNKPRFLTQPVAVAASGANVKPRTFRLPAVATPAPLRFKADGAYQSTPAVSLADFTIRFRTEIAGSPDGIAIYEREERTDGNGQVEVPLIPGTVANPRDYEITVIPPPDSPLAAMCSPQVPVTGLGNSQQPQYMTLTLARKVHLSGTVRGRDGSPAVGANVTATSMGTLSTCPHASLGGTVSSTTDRGGGYRLLVGPGTYSLDIEPATTSPLPRFTEDGDSALVVPAADTVHDIALPLGQLVEGDVLGYDGSQLSAAGIKIFEILCSSDTCVGPARVPPALRAQTRTEMNGHFRVVLPVP